MILKLKYLNGEIESPVFSLKSHPELYLGGIGNLGDIYNEMHKSLSKLDK